MDISYSILLQASPSYHRFLSFKEQTVIMEFMEIVTQSISILMCFLFVLNLLVYVEVL